MRFLDVALTLLAAFLLQTVLGQHIRFFASYLDLFTVTAAAFGLLRGRMFGMLTGATAGLIQDSFSGALLGFNGISKTTVGYLAGIAGHHLIVRGWSRVFFFVLASALDLVILAAVGAAAEQPRVLGEGPAPIYLCFGNAIAGMLLLSVIGRREPGDMD